MKSVVSSKGQITLPAQVRTKLGLAAGTPVQFEFKDSGVLLRKGGPGEHPVDRIFGTLKLGKSVDVLLDELRGPRPKPKGARRSRSRRS